eukprot:m.90577 g.90577  ORF g.90577 m.90577 type:complete len:100 (+) comp11866_c0_seq1:495-794(+)
MESSHSCDSPGILSSKSTNGRRRIELELWSCSDDLSSAQIWISITVHRGELDKTEMRDCKERRKNKSASWTPSENVQCPHSSVQTTTFTFAVLMIATGK